MKIRLHDSKYGKFSSKVSGSTALLASGSCAWASFEMKLVQAGISPNEARSIAAQRYQSLIASCAKAEDQID